MKINHVHFERGLSTYIDVTTRIYNNFEVSIIYLDVQKDLQEAMKLFHLWKPSDIDIGNV